MPKRAAWQVIRNQGAAGLDHRSGEQLEEQLTAEVAWLEPPLRQGTYPPQAVKRVWIEKLGRTEKRPLGIPTVRDRVVQSAIRNVIEPIFEAELVEHSYGFRPGRGAHQALSRVEPLLGQGHTWVVDADLRGYFDTIPQDRLMALLQQRLSDGRLLAEIQTWMEAAGLTLPPEKTRIVDATTPGGFDFLGWHFERGLKWPRKKSLDRFQETLREETPRHSGRSLPEIMHRLNRPLKGWYGYFQGGVKNVYQRLDQWLRGRLRSLLRRREGRKGRGRGRDHHRYPNAYFAEYKLLSLYASACAERSSPAVLRVTH